MAEEKHDEGTASLDKEAGKTEIKPLDLDQLITDAVGGEDDSTPPEGEEPEGAEEETVTQQGSAEPEAEESDSQEQDEAEDQAEGDPGEKSEGNPEWFNRRIGKEVRKRKELEEKLQGRNQEFEDLQKENDMLREQGNAQAPVAAGENPLSKVDSMQKLEEQRQLAHGRMDFVDEVEEFLDDGDIDGAIKKLEAQEVELGADREDYGWEETAEREARKVVKRVRNHARKSLDQWIPRQAQYIQYKDEASVVARDRYKWLGDPDSREMGVFNEAIKNVPLFKNFPDYELQVARYVRGTLLEMDEHGNGTSKPGKKASRKAPPSSASPKPMSAPAVDDESKAAKYRSAKNRVMEKADSDSLDNYIGALLENQ